MADEKVAGSSSTCDWTIPSPFKPFHDNAEWCQVRREQKNMPATETGQLFYDIEWISEISRHNYSSQDSVSEIEDEVPMSGFKNDRNVSGCLLFPTTGHQTLWESFICSIDRLGDGGRHLHVWLIEENLQETIISEVVLCIVIKQRKMFGEIRWKQNESNGVPMFDIFLSIFKVSVEYLKEISRS